MKLLGSEQFGGRTDHYWLHTGDDGNDLITVQTIQDVEPVIENVQFLTESSSKDIRFKASIPAVVVDELCRVYSKRWGIKPADVMREMLRAKTSRSKKAWRMLTEGRDYRKLQAKKWR